jgi:hypothetical protein
MEFLFPRLDGFFSWLDEIFALGGTLEINQILA